MNDVCSGVVVAGDRCGILVFEHFKGDVVGVLAVLREFVQFDFGDCQPLVSILEKLFGHISDLFELALDFEEVLLEVVLPDRNNNKSC